MNDCKPLVHTEFDKLVTNYPEGPARHASISGVLKHFRFQHLPPHLQEISKPFGELAIDMANKLPEGPDLTHGLRNLLAAKDDCVRAKIG